MPKQFSNLIIGVPSFARNLRNIRFSTVIGLLILWQIKQCNGLIMYLVKKCTHLDENIFSFRKKDRKKENPSSNLKNQFLESCLRPYRDFFSLHTLCTLSFFLNLLAETYRSLQKVDQLERIFNIHLM